MTLYEFSKMFYSRNTLRVIHIFERAADMKGWVLKCNDAEPAFTIKSMYSLRSILSEEWCKAEIFEFYAIGKDEIAILVRRGWNDT